MNIVEFFSVLGLSITLESRTDIVTGAVAYGAHVDARIVSQSSGAQSTTVTKIEAVSALGQQDALRILETKVEGQTVSKCDVDGSAIQAPGEFTPYVIPAVQAAEASVKNDLTAKVDIAAGHAAYRTATAKGKKTLGKKK